ncbi:MAG: TIGR01212 family radical SAM protein [Muribaculaceae bacterium]|nr:TIGR01212 family radical SAM protein [Muribaculaceae bacterium]
MNPFFTDYAEYLNSFFPGEKVQKISVNTGAGCPNRDGTIGSGGCIYCRNDSFTPGYCLKSSSITSQIENGKHFFRRKYREMVFLPYFQSYTGTHGTSGRELRAQYKEALSCSDTVGLIVGTRPDCLPDDIVKMMSELNEKRPLFVELGVETTHDSTLRLINRGHTWHQAEDTIYRLADAGLHVGIHLIAGLPGETEEMMLKTVDKVCSVPIESIKFHHLQVLRGTPLENAIESGTIKIQPWTIDNYLELCVNIIRKVPRSIAIERFVASAPPGMVIMPKWGVKNYEFTNLLINKLKAQ